MRIALGVAPLWQALLALVLTLALIGVLVWFAGRVYGNPTQWTVIFYANQDRLGKAIGADLREGKRTLPLIAMLARVKPAESERVKSLLKRHDLGPEEIDEVRRYVVEHEGVEYALAQAHEYARSAKAALTAFAPSEERETLALVADFVVDRDR